MRSILVGQMVAEKEAIVIWLDCYWILVLLYLVTSLLPLKVGHIIQH